MPKKERHQFIKPEHKDISIARQCELLGLCRGSYYYRSKPENEKNIYLMRRIDEIYTKYPYYGIPKMTAQLNREKEKVNHKRIERLMNIMGIQAIRPKRNLSKNAKEHVKYPYLLNKVDINHPNHVWGTDITYIRANGKWFYLVAILDWHSRYVISWKLSRSLESDFCIACLKEALTIALPEINNSDQGVQFTAEDYLSVLEAHESIKISMDGRGRCFDNIFTERLWRSVKYEEVYLKEYNSFADAHQSLAVYFHTYNYERIHENLNYQTPSEIYFGINLDEPRKNEATESSLSPAWIARRRLIPESPKHFITPIINNQKVEISHINCQNTV
ncbi:MAG: IS3 family transposase [Bacteroidota bacterium]|nr:IS3 family transposase [Bacteroidota bacterium]